MKIYTVYEIIGAMKLELLETTDYTTAHQRLLEQSTRRRVLRERHYNSIGISYDTVVPLHKIGLTYEEAERLYLAGKEGATTGELHKALLTLLTP